MHALDIAAKTGIRAMETIAIYWEPRIKTYGLQVATGLTLLELVLSPEQLAQWGDRLQRLVDPAGKFRFVLLQNYRDSELKFYVVFQQKQNDSIITHFQNEIPVKAESALKVTSPVDLVYFQGPHFSERFGIANAIFSCLFRHEISILAAGLSGSSVYLVLPAGTADRAKSLLAEDFEIPQNPDA